MCANEINYNYKCEMGIHYEIKLYSELWATTCMMYSNIILIYRNK